MKRSELVCYCYSVTEGDVFSAISTGARTLGALRAELKVSTCCGGCEPLIRQCLQRADENLQNAGAAAVAPGIHRACNDAPSF